MDHDEALERMEIAAAEPDGLERLMAGDTPEAAEVAGHLAGCPACVDELARIGRTASIVRQVVSAEPDPALRERTLALVRAVGRDRSGQPEIAASPSVQPGRACRRRDRARHRRPASGDAAPAPRPVAGGDRRGIAARRRRSGLRQAAGSPARDRQHPTRWQSSVPPPRSRSTSQPGPTHRSWPWSRSAGGDASGTVAFSPGSGALVVVANGLPAAPAGMEYGCWVEVDGSRRRLGEMYGAGDLQAWSGQADGLADLPIGTTFGVSLVPTAGGAGLPVLTGSL